MNEMPRCQRGIVAVLVAVGMLALLLMAGLAIDTGHLVLNKSRLQSTVDAAALAAATVLDQTGSEDQASVAARSIFDLNAANHGELRDVLSGADIVLQYSETLSPFAPGTVPANYVRVRADDFSMWTSFTALIGFDEFTTGASAVAGPSAPILAPCDLLPMAVCRVPGSTRADDWGYQRYDEDVKDPAQPVTLLKLASGASGDTIGPGNFQLIRLGGSGANVVRNNMAGRQDACAAQGAVVEVEPQPGNLVGAVAQGLNTRFGIYAGPLSGSRADYPPDLVTRPSPDTRLTSQDGITISFDGAPITGIGGVAYSYKDYVADYASGNFTHADGVAERRVGATAIVDCENPVGGASQNLQVQGFGCFFLLQPAVQQGTENWIFGQYLGDCSASGAAGPVGGEGLYKIVLHNDPDSEDS